VRPAIHQEIDSMCISAAFSVTVTTPRGLERSRLFLHGAVASFRQPFPARKTDATALARMLATFGTIVRPKP
jgi:hypothetical protein